MNQNIALREFITEHMTESPRVSIYMPTHRKSPDNKQDPILYKNSVAEAKRLLEEKYSAREAEPVIQKLESLLDDQGFWNHTADGLAVLAETEDLKTFHLEAGMPQKVVVDHQYYMVPLIQYLDPAGTGYLLDLSKDRFYLYRVTRNRIEEVEQDEIKSKFSELFDDMDANADLNFGRYGDGGGTVYHGHRSKSAEEEKDREKYFRYIDTSLPDLIGESPVILAGVSDNVAEYKNFAKGEFYTEMTIDKPFHSMDKDEQLKSVREVLAPRHKEQVEALEERYGTLQAQNRTGNDLKELKEHAEAGRIETLIVAEDPKDTDMSELNHLVATTVATGGEIIVVDASEEPARGILRY